MKKMVERRIKGHASVRLFEVYDEVDKNHPLLIYSGASKVDAVTKAKEYAKSHDISLKCIGAYELTKVD